MLTGRSFLNALNCPVLKTVMKVRSMLGNALMRDTSTVDCRDIQGTQDCQLSQNEILYP